MGIDTIAFIDTDLHDLGPEAFHKELERRIGSKIHLRGFDESPYPEFDREEEVWSLYCYNYDLATAIKKRELVLCRNAPGFFLDLGYHNNTFEIEELNIDGKESSLFYHRFNGFCRLLSESTDLVLKELKELVGMVNRYIRPIAHSTRLFLCGDQVYTEGKGLLADEIYEGMTIDKAIEFESKSIKPDPLYTWDNLDILMKDYVSWGIFDFNLDRIPDYILKA